MGANDLFEPRFTIDLSPIRAVAREERLTAVDVSRGTGIPMPKAMRVLGLSSDSRISTELDGVELVQMCALVGLPVSAVVVKHG